MDVRARDVVLVLGGHVLIVLVLWLVQIYQPKPRQLEVMEVIFVEPPPPAPTPVPTARPTPPPPRPTPPPTPPPTPRPTPPPTPRPTQPPPDPAVELQKFTDAIARKLDCSNIESMRTEASRGSTAEQREAGMRLVQRKLDDCNRIAEEERQKQVAAERQRQEEAQRQREAEERRKEEERQVQLAAERQRQEEAQRQREALQRQIEQERRERELAEQMARQAALEAQLRAEQEAINRGIVQRAGSRWAADVERAIRPNMQLPPGTARELEALFFFRVLPDGTVVEFKLQRSSGNSAFDLAMSRAIERTGNLPPITEPLLAEEIRRNGINLRLTPPR